MTPVVRFTRDAGVYDAQSDGHANRYQLFVERAMALTRRGGRLGLVLPSGLATDHGSAALRRRLLSQCCVARSSAWTTIGASSRSTAASGFCW